MLLQNSDVITERKRAGLPFSLVTKRVLIVCGRILLLIKCSLSEYINGLFFLLLLSFSSPFIREERVPRVCPVLERVREDGYLQNSVHYISGLYETSHTKSLKND